MNRVRLVTVGDTAVGEANYDHLRPLSYPQADVFLICFKCTSRPSFENTVSKTNRSRTDAFLICFKVSSRASFDNIRDKWVPEVRHFCPDVPFVIVATQIDLRDDSEVVKKLAGEKQRLVTSEEGERLAYELGAAKYLECSVFRKTHKCAFSLNSRFHAASIKGTFAVNRILDIPATLFSPLPHGQTRNNLLLKVENGRIDVDIHLIGEPMPNAPAAVARTELHLELCGGADNTFPLIAKFHIPTLCRLPFCATLVSKNGFTSLNLPPSFHGLLTVRVAAGDLNNDITLSAALGAHATILSEDSSSRAYFIRALRSGWWEGDRAEVRVERGRVRVQFSGGGGARSGWAEEGQVGVGWIVNGHQWRICLPYYNTSWIKQSKES